MARQLSVLVFVLLNCCLFVQSHEMHERAEIAELSHIVDNKRTVHCASEMVHEWKLQNRSWGMKLGSTCPAYGACDNPEIRDAQKTTGITLRIAVIVIGNNIITQKKVNDQLATLKQFLNPYNIDFRVVFNGWYDVPPGRQKCVSAYFGKMGVWWDEIEAYKKQYAYKPETTMNIFITCQTKTDHPYALLGFAIMPWDQESKTALGGLWINSQFFGDKGMTLPHEFGHAVGLLHPFIGGAEHCTKPCYEGYHGPNDKWADYVGDYCRDTPATPINYDCHPPAGTDCQNQPWGPTDFKNIMGYAPDSCLQHFTDQQKSRMHCWICKELSNYLIAPSDC